MIEEDARLEEGERYENLLFNLGQVLGALTDAIVAARLAESVARGVLHRGYIVMLRDRLDAVLSESQR